jgi:DNA-binding NtrC family response regulator
MGNFREDLYYRLSVVPLIVPPLRERGSDVIYLVQYFLGQFARKFKRPVPELTSEDKARLKAHHWPGNVRELKNVVERAMILSNEGTLDFAIPEAPKISTEASGSFGNPFSDNPTMNELQGRYINYILNATAGKISGPGSAADILGMKRTTLYARMKKLGLA